MGIDIKSLDKREASLTQSLDKREASLTHSQSESLFPSGCMHAGGLGAETPPAARSRASSRAGVAAAVAQRDAEEGMCGGD